MFLFIFFVGEALFLIGYTCYSLFLNVFFFIFFYFAKDALVIFSIFSQEFALGIVLFYLIFFVDMQFIYLFDFFVSSFIFCQRYVFKFYK